MDWIPVSSSNIESVAYEDDTLFVAFHGGRAYRYDNVPEEDYKSLKDATSVGTHFAAYIKPNYEGVRIY